MDIGTNLRELRERRNMTQQELADILNFNRVQITQYERGTKVIPLPIAIEITKALGCTIEDLTK